MSLASNKTELSAKVEAELFVEYDAMVPGPAASSSAGNNGIMGGDGTGIERTGRPLKINLDLLSYQAKQKNIKVRKAVYCTLSNTLYFGTMLHQYRTDTRRFFFFTFSAWPPCTVFSWKCGSSCTDVNVKRILVVPITSS